VFKQSSSNITARDIASRVVPAQAGTQVYNGTTSRSLTFWLASGTVLFTSVSQATFKSGFGNTKKLLSKGFTKRHGVYLLVYYEWHDNMIAAITREKQMKKWTRAWKLNQIEQQNPDWRDLSEDLQ